MHAVEERFWPACRGVPYFCIPLLWLAHHYLVHVQFTLLHLFIYPYSQLGRVKISPLNFYDLLQRHMSHVGNLADSVQLCNKTPTSSTETLVRPPTACPKMATFFVYSVKGTRRRQQINKIKNLNYYIRSAIELHTSLSATWYERVMNDGWHASESVINDGMYG